MNRLTRKLSGDYILDCPNTQVAKDMDRMLLNKLGQLEDIEEWIEKGLYLRFNGGVYYFKKIVTDFKMIGFCTDRDIAWYYISDYGKMFALTREELKNIE